VKEGEHLALIADSHGFASIEPITAHPNNAELFSGRKPGILSLGEEIFIPDKKPATFTVATGAVHRFRRNLLRVKVRLVLQEIGGEPTAGRTCQVSCAGEEAELATGSDGLLEFPIPPTANEATVVVEPDGDSEVEEATTLKLDIGGIGPVSDEDAAILRLQNLGYFRPCFPEEEEAERRTAIEEFQLDQGLKQTGELDDPTTQRLEAVYGC
jgi:hypothetical protein